jgi:hypothetical protein
MKEVTDSKYFHIHPSVNPKEIVKEISKYDFGFWIHTDSPLNESSIEPGLGAGNKFATYLEAGLPFVYSKQFKFIDKLMKKYGLDCLGINETSEVSKAINKVKYSTLLKRVEKARKELDISNDIPKLENFINTITKKAPKK